MNTLRLALTILLLCSVRCFGATTWPIVGAEVETNGWVLRLTLTTSPGLSGLLPAVTNLAFFNGFGTNNTSANSNALRLDLTSMGYDTIAAGAQSGRRVFGTTLLRLPYPMQLTNDVIAENGSNVVVRLALSDFVFSKDSNITMTAISGAVASTNGSTFTNCSAVSSITVTNSSVQPYPKSIAKWTWVPYERINGSFTLRMMGGHGYARNGSEFAAVKFWAMDGHGNAVTQVVSQTTIDRSKPDAVPFEEYIATLSTSSFTVGDLITNNFQAFPWVGDSSAICDTSDGVNGIETPYHAPLVTYYDNRPIAVAVVSTTNNSGSAGVVTTNFNPAAPPLAFASISQAAKALGDTNNLLFSHNDASGIIYMRGGQHSFIGTAGSHPTTRPKEWLVLTNFPGDGQWNCEIANGTGAGDVQDRVAFRGLYITANEGSTISACSNVWFDNCTFHVTNSGPANLLDGTCFLFSTDNLVTNFDQGFTQQGSQNQVWALIRGNAMYGKILNLQPYTIVGNYMSVTSLLASVMSSQQTGLPSPHQESMIFNNKFMKLDYAGSTLASFWPVALNLTNGAFFGQNIFENVRSNAPGTLVFISADSTTGFSTNLIFHNNMVMGERLSHAYDSLNTVGHARHLWSFKNNYTCDDNTKHDTFTGDTSGAQGARILGWPCLFGVNYAGNFDNEATNTIAGGSFTHVFYGMGSYKPSRTGNNDPPACNANPIRFPMFVDDQSHSNTVIAYIATGNGNYRFQNKSPAFFGKGEWCLRFDIDGKTRSAIDPPGAYSAGNARKGAMF